MTVLLRGDEAILTIGTDTIGVGGYELHVAREQPEIGGLGRIVDGLLESHHFTAQLYFYDPAALAPYLGPSIEPRVRWSNQDLATGPSCRWHRLVMRSPARQELDLPRVRILETSSRRLHSGTTMRVHWFCDPVQGIQFEPGWIEWRDGTVSRIATAIQSEKRWHDMPILADALEEAGCTELEILKHLREGWKHTEG